MQSKIIIGHLIQTYMYVLLGRGYDEIMLLASIVVFCNVMGGLHAEVRGVIGYESSVEQISTAKPRTSYGIERRKI